MCCVVVVGACCWLRLTLALSFACLLFVLSFTNVLLANDVCVSYLDVGFESRRMDERKVNEHTDNKPKHRVHRSCHAAITAQLLTLAAELNVFLCNCRSEEVSVIKLTSKCLVRTAQSLVVRTSLRRLFCLSRCVWGQAISQMKHN